jgi:hypothetical protein
MQGQKLQKKTNLGEWQTVTFLMPEKVRRTLKIASARRGITMSEIVTDSLKEYFSKKKADK